MWTHCLAVLLAAMSNFALGAIWYDVRVFGRIWRQEEGLNDVQVEKILLRPKTYIYSFIYALIAAIGFCLLTRYSTSFEYNLKLAIIVGVLVATSFGVTYQFSNRNIRLFFVDAGYHMTRFIIYAFVFWSVR